MPDLEGLTCVGALAGAFGVQGEVRLKSFCADPAAIAAYAPLVTEDGRSFGVRITRPIPGAFAARLTGIATREEAEALKGTRLYAPRDRLPPLGDDEYYHADLIGLAVVDASGNGLGSVAAVHNFGAGDLIEVKPAQSNATVLLPFTEAAVPVVDIAGRRIVVDAAAFALAASPGEPEES